MDRLRAANVQRPIRGVESLAEPQAPPAAPGKPVGSHRPAGAASGNGTEAS